MGLWGGGGATGWGSSQGPMMRGGQQLKRSVDGWDDEELGKVYDHKVIRRLAPYLKPYKRQVILATLSMIIFSFASLAPYYLVALATNHWIKNGNMDGLALIGVALVALAVVGWVTQYIQQVTTSYVGYQILLKLRTEMFDHIQKLPVSFLDRNEIGRVMSRVQNDVAVIQDLLTTGVLTVLADAFGLFLVVGFMMLLDVQLTLITFSTVPVLIVVLAIWQIRARAAFIRVRQAIAVVNANLQENVSGVRVIQSLSRESENARRFDRVNAENLNANVSAGRVTAAVMPIVELLVSVSTALVIVFGGYRVIDGSLSLGVIIAFALYVQRFFDPVRNLVLQYTQLQRAMAGGERIIEVLDTKPDIVDAENAVILPDVRGEVQFDHVSFDYIPGTRVLDDINLHVKPGETIAIVGSTGAGKSTLTSLVVRFYDVTEGRVMIDGHDIKSIQKLSLARRLGIVLQDPFLFSGSVRENIRYGRLDATDEEIEEAAKTVGAHDFIKRLPDGYETDLHERGQNFSVGQRQLIAFARAIIADPRILILDEATANVDTRTEVVIQKALNKMLKGRTSFVIAHRLSTIRDASRVVVMEHGRIAEQGTHAELLAHNGIYARLYRMTYEQSAPTNGDGHHAPVAGTIVPGAVTP
jgi:ABC-type multidrug transport system fused ATPase/permease subunit